MSVFQPVVRISYHEGSVERAAIITYGLDGLKHYGEPRPLDVDQIPVFLFQLVERGYNVFQDPQFSSMGHLKAKSILAFSKEYHAMLVEKQKRGELADVSEPIK